MKTVLKDAKDLTSELCLYRSEGRLPSQIWCDSSKKVSFWKNWDYKWVVEADPKYYPQYCHEFPHHDPPVVFDSRKEAVLFAEGMFMDLDFAKLFLKSTFIYCVKESKLKVYGREGSWEVSLNRWGEIGEFIEIHEDINCDFEQAFGCPLYKTKTQALEHWLIWAKENWADYLSGQSWMHKPLQSK